jgi:asparagine synthase (glutamine-hydrolysing)
LGFIGFRWTPSEHAVARKVRALQERLGSEWGELANWRGLLVLQRGEPAVEILPYGMGVVFGRRFGADPDASPRCDQRLDPVPGWIANRWGSYIAVLVDRGDDIVRVLRDPTGAKDCYLASLGGCHVFFSDVEAFVALNPEAAADLGFIRAFLRYPPYRGRRTGLAGVEELAPGSCAILPRTGCAIETVWTPAASAQLSRRFDFETGKHALRAAAEHSVGAQCAPLQRIALRLSGGFDSSAMLGLLRQCSEAEIVCVNEYWEGAPEGDERDAAETVARHHGAKLKLLRFDPNAVRYERLLGTPLTARPVLSALGFANPELVAFYRSLECGLITSGQGGDHLFHRSRTAEIAGDALQDRLAPQALLGIALDTARLTGKSVWDVFAIMARASLPMKPALRAPLTIDFRAAEGLDVAPQDHAWLDTIERLSPARALRVRQLLDALSYFDDAVLAAAAPTLPLFLSQPIIEACLAIAPYVMTQGGRERALARAAFADLVPQSVFHRITKGETTRYFSAVLAANAEWIKAMLVGGRLAASGVVEDRAMESLFRPGWLQNGATASVVYALIVAECWLRNLENARERALTAPAGS